jgi:Tol biopolymer transport system component
MSRRPPPAPFLVTLLAAACGGSAAPPAADGVRAAAAPVAGLERIVYSSLRPGNWDIYHFAAPGAAPRRLTDHPGLDYGAVFSPDGRWVVFTSERRGHPDLFVINLEEGGEPRLLVDGPAMEDQAAISPDGATLAFVSTRDGNADVFSMPFRPAATERLDSAVNLTRHPGGDFRPAFSPDSRRIAFSSDRDTPAFGHPFFPFTRQREGELYVMDRDGGNLVRLTESPNWDGSPVWSSDGTTLYFYSARGREIGPPQSPILGQEGGFRIWAIDAGGANPRPVTPEGVEALSPALTADGRIAFSTRAGYADWSIASVALDGPAGPGGPAGLDRRAETDGAVSYWMPSYHAASGAMVCHGVGPVAGDSQAVEAVLGPGGLLAADYPAAAGLPDRQVALYAMRHTTGLAPHPRRNEALVTIENEAGTRLVLADFDGSNERDLFTIAGVGIVSGTENRLFDIKWSSDGAWINYSVGVFAGGPEARADLWRMRPDGTGRVNLTESSGVNNGVAAFAPDGSRLVFRSGRSGTVDLYLMDADGTNVRQLTKDAWRENFPVFSPRGDEIAFSSDRDGAVDRAGHRTFDNYVLQISPDGSPGALRRLTTDPGQDAHPWYSPDGAWIVYTSEQAGISDEEPIVQEVTFGPQMYGELFAYRVGDGLIVRLTHNKWEEGNAFWLAPAGGE